ncbi:hydrolethalus syndrome protein 1 homolog [Monomorium pharaonis]|uniref:hydrolethalus syndrome protein 1 homolog n=1 Tax=Monomorium pharaonis TaxID=307658 RepID=UPI00063FB2A4|nr:hydrolethalus syndrome protein 1 homolog [Monomorium pharaonis]
MSEIKDDPRQVLVLLNSLGFVGITAIQLKGFMKDLKIYRKVKEREKQQRKEEIKTKIIGKQQTLFKEDYKEHVNIDYPSSNIIHSESSNSLDNESVVKVKIRYIPKEEDVQKQKCSKAAMIKSNEKLSKYNKENVIQEAESVGVCFEQNYSNKFYPVIKGLESESKQNISKYLIKNSCLVERCKQNLIIEEQIKPMTLKEEHLVNVPVSLSHASQLELKRSKLNSIGNIRTRSTLSARSSVNSGHKSFIRPWRLQSEVQKTANKKCDPVALYQKYQQEWKQISFPGEAKHLKVRWAVREKMLGTDPHPMPLSKKATHMSILKRK